MGFYGKRADQDDPFIFALNTLLSGVVVTMVEGTALGLVIVIAVALLAGAGHSLSALTHAPQDFPAVIWVTAAWLAMPVGTFVSARHAGFVWGLAPGTVVVTIVTTLAALGFPLLHGSSAGVSNLLSETSSGLGLLTLALLGVLTALIAVLVDLFASVLSSNRSANR